MSADEPEPDRDRTGGQELSESRREHVLEVATALFALHGPATVSLKWVALEADVPAPEVGATWPTVEALLVDVLDRLSALFEAVGGDILNPDPSAGGDVIERYHRIMARALLDRVDVRSVAGDPSLVERWVKVFQDQFGLDDHTARVRLSQTFALEWGWRLFGPHLRLACGLADEPEGRFIVEIRRLEAAIMKMPPVERAGPLGD